MKDADLHPKVEFASALDQSQQIFKKARIKRLVALEERLGATVRRSRRIVGNLGQSFQSRFSKANDLHQINGRGAVVNVLKEIPVVYRRRAVVKRLAELCVETKIVSSVADEPRREQHVVVRHLRVLVEDG